MEEAKQKYLDIKEKVIKMKREEDALEKEYIATSDLQVGDSVIIKELELKDRVCKVWLDHKNEFIYTLSYRSDKGYLMCFDRDELEKII